MAKTPPYPYRVPRGYRYCRGIAAYVPPAYPFLAKKKTFPVRVWYGSDRDKTEPKQHRFRVNLKRILSSPPDSQPLVLFSATPLSLFSAFDSLCLSLPHSIAGALGSNFLTSSLYRQRATERKGRLWIWGLAICRRPEDFPHCGSDCGIFWFLFSFWIWLL